MSHYIPFATYHGYVLSRCRNTAYVYEMRYDQQFERDVHTQTMQEVYHSIEEIEQLHFLPTRDRLEMHLMQSKDADFIALEAFGQVVEKCITRIPHPNPDDKFLAWPDHIESRKDWFVGDRDERK